jgi:hypothetical protein
MPICLNSTLCMMSGGFRHSRIVSRAGLCVRPDLVSVRLYASANLASASRTVAARPRPFDPSASLSGL